MHISPSPWLAFSAAALLPSVTAFYPYQYGDDNSVSSARRTPSSPAPNANTGSITLPIRRVSSSSNLLDRQNGYSIVNSKDPKQGNSVAIDQDGGDLSYMVAMTIGDSKEEYHLLMDSAASNTWVMGQDCTSAACKTHNTFGRGDSSLLKTQDTPFSVAYGTGSVSGTLATDTLHIGALSASVTFGLATNVSSEFRSYPMDGILGIGRGANVPGSIAAPQLMDVLSSARLIPSKLYGIHLSRGSDADGELNLGAVNKDRYSGDLNWSGILNNDNGFWEIPIADAGVDEKPLNLPPRSAIIDTGTSFILMPLPDAVKLHALIPGSVNDAETFSVPCDTAARVQFTVNGQVFDIATRDWRGGRLASGLCRSNIIGRQTFGDSQWLVGDVFLKNVYAVFDFEEKRVGLGVKSAQAATSSSSVGAGASGTARASGQSVQTVVAGASPTAALVAGGASPSPTGVGDVQQGQKDAKGSGAGGRFTGSKVLMVVVFAMSSFIS